MVNAQKMTGASQAGSVLDDTLIDCQRGRSVNTIIRARDTDTLTVTSEIVSEPSSVDSQQLKFFE